MQQIFNFIFKNSNKLLFLLLLGISLILTIQSHSFHRSKVISSANFLTGGVYQRINNVSEYLNLKTQNEILANENAQLKSLLLNIKDTTLVPKIDSIKGVSKINIIVSKVIHNSYNVYENYLTLNSGTKDGVEPDMGVINSNGIVGIVDKTSKNYATVVSILNKRSQINAKIKKTNHFGSLIWDGKSTGFVQLIDVPRLASVRKGDTIVTGGQSVIFPANINIGIIDKIFVDDETNYYTLNVRLFNDMTNLGHVYIIKSKDRTEIKNLEEESKNE
ncbi:rod shape-determining protein MreC [Flavobacterium sp. GT3R68]|uniref:rod shape-determining protein MreC n=1 Tax=Flavobacterium sp. GT3R68 TaxID=2594437 RepID=UPI000F875F0C|nr:rod shape-determining protein MreC [Flavobacterium sp. GT3R68]RTY92452.1 rod shape-determining protein MreC [Flavobacterium sp. GSN2]TRW94077.1 rod shape-determining protein MreC [Flavobacterium sp. GT3R68]